MISESTSPDRNRRNRTARAVDGVSLRIAAGETLGFVGESGSGKSTIGNAILGLVQPTGGRILFRSRDITHLTARQRRDLGRHIQVVFQDPYGSLNPSRSIGATLAEPLRIVHRLTKTTATALVTEILGRVGMPADTAGRYPDEFSGGQRQRIAIARALIQQPELVICDEPTSALDLSVQARSSTCSSICNGTSASVTCSLPTTSTSSATWHTASRYCAAAASSNRERPHRSPAIPATPTRARCSPCVCATSSRSSNPPPDASARAVEPQLRQLNARALIVWGTDDIYFPVKWAYWLSGMLPRASDPVELDSARLFFPEERADTLNALLREHWLAPQ